MRPFLNRLKNGSAQKHKQNADHGEKRETTENE